MKDSQEGGKPKVETHPMIDSAINELEEALLALDHLAVKRLLQENLSSPAPWRHLETLLIPALERIGLRWEQGEVALSQVYLSGRICEDLVDTLLPQGTAGGPAGQPRLAIAVLEDYHLLGKRIVYSMLRASGFAISDYGRVTVEALIRRAQADGIEILLVSTLMLPSALRVRDLCAQLRTASPRVKVVVGGAPFRFDTQLWQEVGADAMGYNASDAMALVQQMKEGVR
jgi:methanogenic corrinoid protein MtbC1